jgi:hypothetical protein
MNKKEMHALCSLIAEWEFRDGGSSSGAVERSSCIEELRSTLNISDDDLSFYRAWKICEKAGDQSDEFLDLVNDMVDADYRGLLDAIDDAKGFHVVKELVETKVSSLKI